MCVWREEDLSSELCCSLITLAHASISVLGLQLLPEHSYSVLAVRAWPVSDKNTPVIRDWPVPWRLHAPDFTVRLGPVRVFSLASLSLVLRVFHYVSLSCKIFARFNILLPRPGWMLCLVALTSFELLVLFHAQESWVVAVNHVISPQCHPAVFPLSRKRHISCLWA